jgi:hypothetical protein
MKALKDIAEAITLSSLGGAAQEPEQSFTESAPDFQQHSPSSGASGLTSSVEDRALKLLGSGIQAEQVAAALGVTPSRIAQMLAQDHFASSVAKLRYAALQSHNKRDSAYDTLEDTLLVKLEKSLPLMIKPESILKAIAVVNGAKRRGQSAPAQTTNQQNVVNLVLPTIMVDKFAVDINNQVIRAGDQSLLTMPSGNLLKQVEEAEELRIGAPTGEE